MLVNWKIEYADKVAKDKQPPDYFIKGEPYWFFRYLKNDGYDVDVIDSRSFKWLENFEKNNIRFYIWQTIKELPKLNKYDVVLSHGMQSGIMLALFRRLFGKGKYKHIVFDIGAFNSAKTSGRALKFMQFAGKSIDGIIYHTKSQKHYYEECHPWLVNKSTYIPFGTDTKFFNKEDCKDSDKENYILCVGYNKRDWDTLIKAYMMTDKKYKLYLLGNDKLEITDDNIHLIKAVDVNQMKNMILASRFCVLPLKSFNYSFGQMTLLQQMALGKAVIVADVPSVNEYINDGEVVTYIPENFTSLSGKMQKLMDDDELCEELGKKAAAAVKEKYNEQIMAKAIEEVLLKCISDEK